MIWSYYSALHVKKTTVATMEKKEKELERLLEGVYLKFVFLLSKIGFIETIRDTDIGGKKKILRPQNIKGRKIGKAKS